MGDEEKMVEMLETVLANVPAEQRELMKVWAHREVVGSPLITSATARMWVNSYVDEKTKKTVPAGWHTLTWEVGKEAPSNPDAMIFAMVQEDERHVKVFSFGHATVEGSDEVGIVYFHETIFHPQTIYGPITGSALFEKFADYFANEDELKKLRGQDDDGEQHTNGAVS